MATTTSAVSEEGSSGRDNLLKGLHDAAAQDLPEVVSSKPLAGYFQAAEALRQRAMATLPLDKQNGYVLLLRYTTFVLERLPLHRQYGMLTFDELRTSARAHAAKALTTLEALQVELKGGADPSQSSNAGASPVPSAPPPEPYLHAIPGHPHLAPPPFNPALSGGGGGGGSGGGAMVPPPAWASPYGATQAPSAHAPPYTYAANGAVGHPHEYIFPSVPSTPPKSHDAQ